jgi:hypothetical protein
VNGISFQPDLVWVKNRSSASTSHTLYNTNVGIGTFLQSNTTDGSFANAGISPILSDGFTAYSSNSWNNASGQNYIAWQWKAGSSNVTNNTGSITSTVRVNTTAGFSIVDYTGNGTVGATVGHGLGVTPGMVIVKSRSATADWPVKILPYMAGGSRLELSTTNGITTENAGSGSLWNATNPNSTVITLGNQAMTNTNGTTYVAYCFAPISGYSAFGSYTGNGSTDGPFIYTGFRPRWVMVKRTDGDSYWQVLDTSRSPYNLAGQDLFPNLSAVEATIADGVNQMDIVSNGFKFRNANCNASGLSYIYVAFAENPFTISRAR